MHMCDFCLAHKYQIIVLIWFKDGQFWTCIPKPFGDWLLVPYYLKSVCWLDSYSCSSWFRVFSYFYDSLHVSSALDLSSKIEFPSYYWVFNRLDFEFSIFTCLSSFTIADCPQILDGSFEIIMNWNITRSLLSLIKLISF